MHFSRSSFKLILKPFFNKTSRKSVWRNHPFLPRRPVVWVWLTDDSNWPMAMRRNRLEWSLFPFPPTPPHNDHPPPRPTPTPPLPPLRTTPLTVDGRALSTTTTKHIKTPAHLRDVTPPPPPPIISDLTRRLSMTITPITSLLTSTNTFFQPFIEKMY